MSNFERRKFLKVMGAGAAASMLPPGIGRALAIPANNRTGTIADVEYIVVLTQENRSFDHYFGAMKGVRGFNDPTAVKLPGGKPVWYQPNGADYVLPFRPDVPNAGLTFVEDVNHGWNDGHGAWNNGVYDQWVPNKGTTGMTYLTRNDLPYHYALADAFTVCDAYFCSLMGPTDPNRYHMWTGWVGNDGNGGGPVITNAEAGYDWSTYPERLQAAGITWKVYQDIGLGLTGDQYWGWTGDAFIGNYGDNSLLYFHQYQNAQPGNPLADFAKTGTNINAEGRNPLKLLADFRQDVLTGKLPQVSWIAPPEAYSEHPNFTPAYGAWYISQVIDALAANPEVWSKTALFINYDENGGFFDHLVPPTPPTADAPGMSTVDTVNEIFPGDGNHPAGPYGLGTRVPMLVVSPWSKGGWVNSQVFDHTSLIRFIEARFGNDYPGLIETNITPWRRAVAGDLTSAFDFSKPSNRRFSLPSTLAFMPTNLNRQDDYTPAVPADQMMPVQEPGVRPARALPYSLHAHGVMLAVEGAFRIDLENTGTATAVFQVRSGMGAEKPRSYTLEPGKQLADKWDIADLYDLAVYGPNGFLRSFKGGAAPNHRGKLVVQAVYDEVNGNITLNITNLAPVAVKAYILDKYTGKRFPLGIAAQETRSKSWALRRSFHWYDLTVTVNHDAHFEYRLAGHVETGKPSASDPALGGLAMA